MNQDLLTAGSINRQARITAQSIALPGMTLKYLDEEIEKFIQNQGGVPTFKGYQGFPAASCLSVNDVAVHGIPDDYLLQHGDVLTVDVGVTFNGWIADSATTFIVGNSDSGEDKSLIEATKKVLSAQLSAARAGATLWDLVIAAEKEASDWGLNLFADLGGHYTGRELHIEPFIPVALNYSKGDVVAQLLERQYKQHVLKEGDIICLEPVATFGKPDIIMDADGWTCRSACGAKVAHFEHCVEIASGFPFIIS